MSVRELTHDCGVRHRTWKVLAQCEWPRAAWVSGSGPWAFLSRCPHGPHDDVLTVTLCRTEGSALAYRGQMDLMGCGGRCEGRHEVVRLVRGERT
jgi:hypothetical protein